MARTRTQREKGFAVIGLGVFGRQVCETITARGGTVVAIDNSGDAVERVREMVSQAILLDTTDEDALSEVPLDDIDVAVVAMGDNVEASILTTALLKQRSVSYVIARAVSQVHARVLAQVGADEVINVETDAGTRLGARLVAPHVLEQFALSSEVSVAECYVPRPLVGKTLADANLRQRYDISVIAIRRVHVDVDEVGNPSRREEFLLPGPHDEMHADDVIHIIGSNEAIEQFPNIKV